MRHTVQPFTEERLSDSLAELPPAESYRVAFSGGADSTALLYALCALRDTIGARLSVFHVDHGLHPDSGEWSEHCRRVCAELQVPLEVRKIVLRSGSGLGQEAEARRLRYAAAEAILEPGDILLTAHHAEDQAETVLLNLMRGSGIDGLAGMPHVRPLGRGLLARPLLHFSRSSLRDYLVRRRVAWIEDSSNRDERHDRNFVRQRLLPLMEQRWTGARDHLVTTAAHCREASDYLSLVTEVVLRDCLDGSRILDLARLRRHPACTPRSPGLKQTLRHWLKQAGAPSLPRKRLEELCRQLQRADAGRPLQVAWSGWTLRRHRQRLWLQQAGELRSCPSLIWDTQRPLNLGPGLGHLSMCGPTPRPNWRFEVRARGTGERIACLPGGRHKRIKQVFQDVSLPPWLRSCVPLLFEDEHLAAVAHWTLSNRLRQRLTANGCHIEWRPTEPALAQFVRRTRPERG